MSVYLRKPYFHTAILGVISASLLSCSSTRPGNFEKDLLSRKSDFSVISTGPGPHLSEVIAKNQSTKILDPSRQQLVEFVSQKRKESTYQTCQKKFGNAVECIFVKPDWNHHWFLDDTADNDDKDEVKDNDKEELAIKLVTHKKHKASKWARKKTVQKVVQYIRKGNIARLPEQEEGDFYRALKTFPVWSPELGAAAAKALSEPGCGDLELYNYLGLKAEEFFPNDAMVETSTGLYRKVDECAKKDPSLVGRYVQNSRFRLGLLLLMKENCSDAKDVFGRLVKMGITDYSSRALYWSAYCSKAGAKREEFIATFDQLFKINPIGFHTMTMTSGSSLLLGNLSQPVDPTVRTRTLVDEQYNYWIEALEDLDTLKNYAGVRNLLSPVRLHPEYLRTLEPGVRLYLSTFAYRASDTVSLFRILDSVFSTQSEYVVDSTLRLFYPLKYLQSISEKVKRVNPFLITALVRQESAFQENARSPVGAVGLMQLMPRTARLMERGMTKKRLYNPEVNLRLGIRFFERLVDRYEGDVELALAAYNAGAETVDRWRARYPMTNRLLFLDLIPYSETRNYVSLIGRNYYWYSNLYANDAKTIAQNSMLLPVEFRSLNSNAK